VYNLKLARHFVSFFSIKMLPNQDSHLVSEVTPFVAQSCSKIFESSVSGSEHSSLSTATTSQRPISMSASSAPNGASSASQVKIQLSTRDPELRLPEGAGPILVSTGMCRRRHGMTPVRLTFMPGLKRYALSVLVNKLLEAEKPVPYEFLIKGQFLRTSIDDFLTANGISSESTLSVEYVRAIIPPLFATAFEHDDWVSSVDVLSGASPAAVWAKDKDTPHLRSDRILSGSYDGSLRLWDTQSELLATSPSAGNGGHAGAIKAVKFLSPTSCVSSGNDRTVRVWECRAVGNYSASKLSPTVELFGHVSGINCLAVHGPSSRILSGSTDQTICVWSSKKAEAPPAPPNLLPSGLPHNKRRRLENPAKQVPNRGPLRQLTGHTGSISGVIFSPVDQTVAYSSAWDHSVRTWDLPTGTCVDSRSTSHPVLSLCAMNGTSLLAAGSSARHITMVDPRASATTVAAMTLRGHTNAVVSLCADPASSYGLVSGSHDGTCRLWDIRSVRPGTGTGIGVDPGGTVGECVYVIERESMNSEAKRRQPVAGDGVKVFGVVWDQDVGIVSAGEDKKVQINRPSR